jgi:hypothetical protein
MRMKRGLILFLMAMLIGLSVNSADAGLFQNLWRLEQRKNAWLRRTFLDRDWRFPRIFRNR